MHNITDFFLSELSQLTQEVNSFKSEKIQLKVIDDIFTRLEWEYKNLSESRLQKKRTVKNKKQSQHPEDTARKMGSTKIIRKLLETSFFAHPKYIQEIRSACNNYDGATFRADQISGILSRMADQKLLKRHIDPERNQYVYIKGTNNI